MLTIKIDSSKVVSGDTFVAIEGSEKDGHDYVAEAIKKGASKIIVSKPVPFYKNVELVEDTSVYLQEYLKNTYSPELKKLKIIGITGTNGKTTTVSFIHQLLAALEVPSAYIGTLGYHDKEENIPLLNTTPDIVTNYNLLLHALNKGIQVVALEVSSHALKQKRVYGIPLCYAGFTNITLDHLDYHKTMQDYVESKALLTTMLDSKGKIVINVDDPYHTYFQKVSYIEIGKKAKDYKLKDYSYQYPNSHLTFYHQQIYHVKIPILGEFNMYNYLMAIAIIKELGYSIVDILKVSKLLHVPSGRCETFTLQKGVAMVDYAHTPDAVENVLKSIQLEAGGRIITVIGCGGERDQKKRPMIGQIATKYSDLVIFTNDNPRSENPMTILTQITASITTNNYVIIKERQDAIKQGTNILDDKDILVVLGKGHEKYQIIGGEIIYFSDIEEVQKYQ